MKKKKKENQNSNIKKYTITSNHTFSNNVSKILDELGKTSKNTFNHYLFCYKFYLVYKDIVYEQVYNESVKNKSFTKDKIDSLIHSKFKYYYDLYQTDYKNYINNNNKLYEYIKKLNFDITHTNFIQIYNKLILECFTINGLNLSNKNLYFLYENNIFSILTSFYYYKYYNVKTGLINKIPIKVKFDDNFKNHVMTTEKPINFNIKPNYKELLSNILDINKIKYKLTLKNITKEEEKKYKLGSEQNFISRLVYSTMKFDKTSSDLIVNILPKAHEAICSYYELRKLGKKANKPNYLTEDFYSLIFCGKTILIENNKKENKEDDKNKKNNKKQNKQVNKNQIRLLYGDYIIKNWKKLFNEELDKNNIPLLKIRKPTFLKKENVKLKQVEIKKISSNTYKVYYKFDVPKQVDELENKKTVKLSETISIDLGLKNLFTIHDPYGEQRILRGGHLIALNEYFVKKISIVQSKKDKTTNKTFKEEYNNEIKLLNDMRLRKLNGKINIIIQKIKELYSNKKLIIIGYNKNWKTNINIGKDNNRKFYQIPFSRIISKIRYALKGKTEIAEINEAYTSKCDALGLEDICKHEEYLGDRKKRGLFSSSTHKLLNADLNGAINILRKYSEYKYNKPLGLNLFNPVNITL
jgi:putative transposase